MCKFGCKRLGYAHGLPWCGRWRMSVRIPRRQPHAIESGPNYFIRKWALQVGRSFQQSIGTQTPCHACRRKVCPCGAAWAVVRVESPNFGATMKSLQACRKPFFLSSVLGLLVQSPPAFPTNISSSIRNRSSASGNCAGRATRFRLQYWYLEDAHIAPPESLDWFHHPGSNTTVISLVREILNGHANLFELTADGPAGHIEGVGLRLYNPQSQSVEPQLGQWQDGHSGRTDDRGVWKMAVVYS